MTPTRAKIHRAAPLLLVLPALLAGCGTTRDPSPELRRAEAALGRARQAEAATHAPSQLQRASARMDAARLAAADRKPDDALKLAVQAEVDADLALAASRKARAQAAVEAMQRENAALQSRLGEEGDSP